MEEKRDTPKGVFQKKVGTIGFEPVTSALRNVGRDRQRSTVEVINKEPVAALKLLGASAILIGRVELFLVDEELLGVGRHGSLLLAW